MKIAIKEILVPLHQVLRTLRRYLPSTHWWFKRAKRAKTRSNCAKRARNPSNEYRNQVFS